MKKIGKYRIRGLLGKGGMGKVFKVCLEPIGKIMALKQLHPHPHLLHLMGLEKIKELFLAEAVILANLRHPNIVNVSDWDEIDGFPFYTMDFYANNLGILIGETYRTEAFSRILPVEKALHYTEETLNGLACLHYNGIIHRDIKPFNLLITEQDVVKICDFGLSKTRGENLLGPSNLKIGSPWYAAPEQENHPETADERSDLYAVGILLYRMVTGRLPEKKPELPSRINPVLDETWDYFILKAFAKKPLDRFNSAGQMLSELLNLRTAWLDKKEKECRITDASSDLFEPKKSYNPITGIIRNTEQKIALAQAKETFVLDTLWQPYHYIENDFEVNGDSVSDRTTSLTWQMSGSPYPLSWDRAHEYVYGLNRDEFGESNYWRLPTVNELMSLLVRYPDRGDLCIEPIFDDTQKWLWSIDRCTYVSAWYVSMDLGFVARQDRSALLYVRAVRAFFQ